MGNRPVAGEGMVLVEGSIFVPEMQNPTRSFDAPAISTLHVLVCDQNGYVIHVADAKPVDNTFGVEKDTEYKFMVELPQAGYKRTIHLIANSPKTINKDGSNDYGMGQHERHVVKPLYTEGRNEAYWAVVELPDGIMGESGSDTDGNPVFKPVPSLQTALTKVPMVRNYSRVSIENKDAEFDNVKVQVWNVPTSGSVAPFISDGVYAQFAKREGTTNTELGYSDITKQGFVGFEPAGRELGNTEWSSADKNYVEFYERTTTNIIAEEAPFAIVSGTYQGAETFYKVDICYKEGESQVLYNLLRNIEYRIVINDVLGAGYSSAAEAAANVASNNLSHSVDTKNLLNISDGERRLSVEYTQKVLVEGNASFSLLYRYEPQIGGNSDNGAVVFSGTDGGDVIASVGDIEAITTGTYAGWNRINFTSTAIEGVKRQSITLSAGGLQRTVEYILGQPYPLVLDMPTKVAAEQGTPVSATLDIGKGLLESMFPLEFYVVVENGSLSSSYPVVTGLSRTGEPVLGGQYFGYLVTVEADDYFIVEDGKISQTEFNNIVDLSFVTSKEDSSSVVNVYNPYFNVATDSFYADVPYGLDITISSNTATNVVTTFTTNTSGRPIADEDWSTDSNGNKYFDFEFSYSPANLTLASVAIQGVTTNLDTYAVVTNDGKLRVYKAAYDKGYKAFTLTFTGSNVMGTTITANNASFGTASATVEKAKLTMKIVSANNSTDGLSQISDNTNYYLYIEWPAGSVPSTLTINATATRTALYFNNTQVVQSNRNQQTGSYRYDVQPGATSVYIPFKADMSDSSYNNAVFTLNLSGGDEFQNAQLSMKGGRTGSYNNYTYYFNMN